MLKGLVLDADDAAFMAVAGVTEVAGWAQRTVVVARMDMAAALARRWGIFKVLRVIFRIIFRVIVRLMCVLLVPS